MENIFGGDRCLLRSQAQEHYRRENTTFSIGYTILSSCECIGNAFLPSAICVDRFGQILQDVLIYTHNHVIILLQSVIRTVLENGNAQVRRQLKEMLFGSLNSRCVIFYNENCKETFKPRRISVRESPVNYQNRLFELSAAYLQRQLGACSSITVVLATASLDPLHCQCKGQQASNRSLASVRAVTMEEYVSELKVSEVGESRLQEMMSIVHSTDLLQTRLVKLPVGNVSMKPRNCHSFRRHLSRAEIRAGLRSGTLQCGELSIFAYASTEGEVLPSSENLRINSAASVHSSVLIRGIDSLNRAMHGDAVVYEMLPQSEWVSVRRAPSLLEGAEDTDEVVEEEGDVDGDASSMMGITPTVPGQYGGAGLTCAPTGRVVGILRRCADEIAATIPYKRFSRALESGKVKAAPDGRSFSVSNRDEYVLCIPLDRRFPCVRIVTKQWEKLQGQRVIVCVDDWPQHSKFPNGHFIRSLGPSGEWKTELEALMLKHCVHPRPFSTRAMACLPQVCDHRHSGSELPQQVGVRDNQQGEWVDSHWQVPSIEGRRDLRESCRIFSVDPPGCQDIDDAMSVSWIERGVIEVGVHIADVCAFLEQGSALDAEAQARATTVYLTHARIDMLPSLLSSDIASLHGEKDRYAITVLFRVKVTHRTDGSPVHKSENMMALDEKDDILFDCPQLPHWAGRSVIHSMASMTYDQAQNLIRGLPPDAANAPMVPEGQAGRPVKQSNWEPLRDDLTILTAFTRHLLRSRGSAGGALDLAQTEGSQLKIKLDKDGFPVQIDDIHPKEIHNTIAELMILANSAVARLIYSELPSASLVRIHPPPSADKMREMQELTESLGLHDLFKGGTNEDIQRGAREFKMHLRRDKRCDESVINFITAAVIRCMSMALYQCSEFKPEVGSNVEKHEVMHYGLGLEFYTHFTSPIRRYADVIVHRQLLAVLEYKAQPDAGRQNVPSVSDVKARSVGVVLPPSRAMSIVDEAKMSSAITRDQSNDGVDVQVKRTADGRILVEKTIISSPATADVQPSVSTLGVTSQSANSLCGVDVMKYENEDVDLLDSLLGDVGDSLMDTVTRADPVSLLNAAAHSTTAAEATYRTMEAEPKLDITDELDMLLGDISAECGLSAQPDKAMNIAAPFASTVKESNEGNDTDWHMTESRTGTDIESSFGPPYSAVQLARIANHLNAMNMKAKIAQYECQELYLRHYFTRRQEVHWAVVCELKQNGIVVFVPAFDHKGPVYLTGRDNITIQCAPEVLGLFKDSGIEPRATNCRGHAFQGVRAFPSLKSVLLAGGDGVDEFVICPKDADPASACGEGTLRVTYLQRVQVLICSASPAEDGKQIGIPQLRLQLVGVREAERVGAARVVSSEFEPGISKNCQKVSEECNQIRDTPSATSADVGGESMSLYKVLSVFRLTEMKPECDTPGKSSEKERLRITTARNFKRKEKAMKVVKQRRHVLHGTGRVAFGEGRELPPLFTMRSAGGLSSGAFESKDATMPFLRGKEAAMQQMKAWGEEWAEEEDLPGGCGQIHTEEGGVESGGQVDISKYNLGRETAMATQRIHKLKTAKRNSKY